MSLVKIQTPPKGNVLLLTGTPGAGKSTFCHQIIVKSIADQLPVIFVTTEQTSGDALAQLSARGLGEEKPDLLSFVDAFTQTVGLVCSPRQDMVCAHCADLNSLSMAITKLSAKLDGKILLVIDSLTSPYLFNGMEVVRFMQLFLTKFAQEGNPVLAAMDEGCGKEGDLGAMRSVANGIIRLEMHENEQTIQVVKHPEISPSYSEIPIAKKFRVGTALDEIMEPEFIRMYMRSLFAGKTTFRPRLGDFVNAFWPKLAYWSGMLWDPQGFPMIIYEHNREEQSGIGSDMFISIVPQPYKTMFRMIKMARKIGIFPPDFEQVADMKRVWWWGLPYSGAARMERYGKIEYLPEKSKSGEHYYRIYENSDCWDFKDVGASIASYLPPVLAGNLIGLEAKDRIWNAIETQCIGLGDPYCEVKLVPGEIEELQEVLEKDAEAVARIHTRLIDKYTSHLLESTPLTDRPGFGPDIHLQIPFHTFGFSHIAGDRTKMALRMGGAKTGKEITECLLSADLNADETIERVFSSIETLKAGTVSESGGKVKIEENIEPMRTQYMTRLRELSCYFTTGFLNGLYGATHGLRIKETKCTAAGDSHCEWEIV